MSTAWEGALPGPTVEPRASDHDRAQVVATLREAAGDGLIDLDELEHRIGLVFDARTKPELASITVDLPAAEPEPARSREPGALDLPAFRLHLSVYVLTIAMLVIIWAAAGAGRPFWPLFPAAGWGIGLGAHWQAADAIARRRADRRRRADQRAVTAPPPPPARAAVRSGLPTARRFVVAMFVDVAGSTALNEALGDERWADVRRSFRSLVSECVDSQGGWEANCSGDGILARFDDPAAAATSATAILRRLERQRAETGFAPSVRVGIHSGDAVEDGDDIIGNVVNLAARVTDAAAVDEILVTEHVADHLDGRHATEGRGLHTLKGVARPRHLLALVWR